MTLSRLGASVGEAWRRRPLAATVLVCAALTSIALSLRTIFPETSALLLYGPLIGASAAVFGYRPALTATGVSVVAGASLGESVVALGLLTIMGIAAALAGEYVFRRLLHDRTMQALAEREAHLRSIFDTAPEALIVIDERGLVQAFSASAERMFGWEAAEVLGRDINMLMPAPFRGEHKGYIDRYLATGERRIIGIGRIVVGERKDGSTFPAELAVGEVRSERGRFFTGFIRDVSERQETQARLQELQSELIQVARLTALGEMASALAHEINQPLGAIANYLSGARTLLAQSGATDTNALEALDKASEQALRAGEVIKRLRDFLSRGEAQRKPEVLSKLTREACALALVGAKDRGVRVAYEFDPAADAVLVDRVPIQQVVVNLVRNAVDAMDGSPRRELRVTSQRGEANMAVLSVADSGPGVSAAAGERLFQPFVTTKSDGMGVGLSISRTIVEAHGGRIWTEPNAEGGAVFNFTMPLALETGVRA